MSTYEDLKKHCESVPVNHFGMRIACVQADTILELIARVEAAEHASAPAWLPIETAPKDGSEVLVGLSGEFEVGYFMAHENKWVGSECVIWPDPTHWMAIPEMPK